MDYSSSSSPVDDARYDELRLLTAQVFGSEGALDGRWRLENMPELICFEARTDGLLVGFKIGYAHTSKRFYSWLGGVHPDYRRQGIAGELMLRQHGWVSDQGYAVLETEVRQSNRAMLSLNLNHGFTTIGEKHVNGNKILILRKFFD